MSSLRDPNRHVGRIFTVVIIVLAVASFGLGFAL